VTYIRCPSGYKQSWLYFFLRGRRAFLQKYFGRAVAIFDERCMVGFTGTELTAQKHLRLSDAWRRTDVPIEPSCEPPLIFNHRLTDYYEKGQGHNDEKAYRVDSRGDIAGGLLPA
jgi:hypothetical protein